MIDDAQQRRFHELRLEKGRLYRDDRLFGEYEGALRHRVHVARKAEGFQVG